MNTKRILVLIFFAVVMQMRSSNAQSIPQAGLVASYSFNGNANDATAFGNNGILGGTNLPFTTADRFGNLNSAYQLGGCGNSNWIRVPNSLSLQFNKKLTVSLWFKQCDFAGMNGSGACVSYGGWKILYAKAGDAYGANPSIYCGTSVSITNKLTVFNNNKNCWGACPLNYSGDTSANCVDTCEWVHLVTVIDSNQWKMYFNGQLVKQKTINVADFSGANSQDLYFGRMFPGNWYPFGGTLDDINIYNRALNQSQIDSLYGNFYNNYSVNISPTPAILCNGSSLNLVASGAVNYSWAPSPSLSTTIGPNVIVNPSSTNTYILTYIDSNGCTGSLSKTVTVNPTQNFSVNNSICQGQSYYGYTSSGIYIDTFQNMNGCDSIRTLNLVVNQSTSNSTIQTACNSYTWSINGQTYTSSGIYTSTSINGAGCPHTEILNLTINYSTSNTSTQTACNSYTWSINGQTYTSSGIYSSTSINGAGCPHTEILNLTINYSTSNTSTQTNCNSYTWSINGQTYTSSGIYTSTSINGAGCPHTEILNLTINYSTSNTSTQTACNSYTWSINGQTYTSSGIYTSTSINGAGCPHTEILNLTINYSTSNTSIQTACNSYTWSINGQTYTSSGIYTSTSINGAGCIHTEILNLTINYSTSNTSTQTACNSYTWSINGQTYTSSGIYTSTSINGAGCIHTEILNLTISYSTSNTSIQTACNSYTWSINGQTYTSSGIYTSTSINGAGCIHTEILNLTISNSTSNTTIQTACNSYTWSINGQTYTSSGIYTSISINGAGCPHTEILNLTINYSTSNTSTQTACNSYTWSINGQTYTSSGIYTSTSINGAGCPHTEILNLTINYSTSNTSIQTACNSYTWSINGQTYTSSGVYTFSSTNGTGCIHTEILNLTINYSTSNTSTQTACNSYTWSINGQTYTSSGVYTFSSTNGTGCIHTEILNLTINYSTSNTSTQTACNSYTWSINGQTYTSSGIYSSTSINGAGCPHTEILNLTINYSTSNTTIQTACNSYTWSFNGQTYTSSGIYTSTSINGAGCIHTEILNLTISNSTSNTTIQAACNSYTWSINGQTYTSSGVYSFSSTNVAGCIHTEILNLTINYSTSNTTIQTACNSYTWSINGQTYTSSGIYTSTSINGAGCIHTEILNLTISNSTSNTTIQTACNSYTWSINGQTYTSSGVYSFSSTNVAGCIHTEILNLTISNSTSNTTIQAACNSYTWSINGQTYTSSGVYSFSSTNVAGCIHTEILNLTINYSTSNTTIQTACNSYTWSINGQTYTSSGVYSFSSTNVAGCIHTEILNLTISNSTSNTTIQAACNSYTWSINGQTYTSSGIYTSTSINGTGCIHTEILNLTISNSSSNTSTQTACNSHTWSINGQTYTSSGVYTFSSTNGTGCIHTEILNLTISYSTSNTTIQTACNSYTWSINGQTYTSSGIYTSTSINGAGCIHTEILDLIINTNSSPTTLNISGCDSIVWNGNFYSVSGIYTNTFINAFGCDSIQILNVIIGNSNLGTSNVSSCNNYFWNGNTYFTSGIYIDTFTNINLCDSIHSLNLTIHNATSSIASVSACDSFTWGGSSLPLTASGVYMDTLVNSFGCDSLVTLILTINNTNNTSSNIIACDSYLWNGNIYTNSGIFIDTFSNVLGCDSIHTLNIIINYDNNDSSSEIACNVFNWNGINYTTSGMYNATFTNLQGCDSLHTLNLTILLSNSSSSNMSACDTYSWNGNTYTVSGAYTATFTNVLGCDSLHTLNLTINQSTTNISSQVSCDNFIWLIDGNFYDKSGQYIFNSTNNNGCPHSEILDLVINKSNETTIEQEICIGENYMGYTKPGKYTDIYKNILGCDSLRILNLAFNESTCCQFLIPNAFTPNKDGLNDEFKVLGKNDFEIFEFSIMNRWGQMVYKTSDTNWGWDGNYKGEACESGTYFYFLKYKCLNKPPSIQKGDLTLIR